MSDLGGEPPCMMHLVDDDGRIIAPPAPDASGTSDDEPELGGLPDFG